MPFIPEFWLRLLADMETFTDSDDELSRLVRETIEESGDGELSETELTDVTAAQKIPPLPRKPDMDW